MKIVKAETINSKLLIIRKKSLLRRLYLANWLVLMGLIAKTNKLPTIYMAIKDKINIPLSGSFAKAWTEVSSPDLTINVPTIDNANPKIDNNMHQFTNIPLFSITIIECIRAVATIQGIREAFSTGSQNQKPPQPNS